MINTVIKADGRREPFAPEKINRWGQFADDGQGGDWTSVVMKTVNRLPEECTSEHIHQTMIDICVELESIVYSKYASRLQFAMIRKTMNRNGISGKGNFTDIVSRLCELGVWDEKSLPAPDERWNVWYKDLYPIRLDYWQVKQFDDKYGLKYNGNVIETPHIAALGIGLAHFGNTENAFNLAKAILEGKINLPTPALNGGRNGDFDSISCCIITGGDTVDSIGVAEHIAYKMTAKKAGIGLEMQTRSKGAPVKGGRVEHLGKHSIFEVVDKSVKMFSQVTRGGSATVTYSAIDPQIMEMLMWKTQKVDIEQRIDKLDYSFAYNDAFMQAVIQDKEWYLFDLQAAPHVHNAFYRATAEEYNELVDIAVQEGLSHGSVNARTLLKRYLAARQETGRIYCLNVTRANSHTPFEDTIYLSNLCQEIMLPTKPYVDMDDLRTGKITELDDGGYDISWESEGETAFCALAAMNVGRVLNYEYGELSELCLRTVDSMIEKAPAMSPTMKNSLRRRRSVGMGITGLAQYLYRLGLDYDGSEESLEAVSDLAERHCFHAYKASVRMVQTGDCVPVSGITNWLPVDTAMSKYSPKCDWESIRGMPRGHSVLIAHMPTESSALFSGATNGLYPPREKIVYKQSRKGAVQFIVDKDDFIKSWDVPNNVMSKYYGRVQDFSDQGISADYYIVPERYENGKVPLSLLMKEWMAQARAGVKSMYYTNVKPNESVQVKDIIANAVVEEEACEGGCKI